MHSAEAIELYSQFNERWFERAHYHDPSDDYLEACAGIVPDDWRLTRDELWYFAGPPEVELPDQGWKLHISATSKDSRHVLDTALPILVGMRASFKFLVDPRITSLVNGKLFARGASGKFITIYPRSREHFLRLGQCLADELDAIVGPYILSDRRWPGSKAVYYRYGGFRSRSRLQVDGSRRHVIEAPNGELVTDPRVPYWDPPEWAHAPFTENRGGGGDEPKLCFDGDRFVITSALTFSNRGGVYKGIDNQTGREVIIKEARPNVELGSRRLEAVVVLEKEFRLLKRLASTGLFVKPIAMFQAWEHTFLVEEFVPGGHLGRFTILNNPLYSRSVNRDSMREYLERIAALWKQIALAIAIAHEYGIALRDLSFTNILVSSEDDERIKICDLETATELGVDDAVGLHTPGLSTHGVSERANDYYALGALMFGCIMLVHGVVGLHSPTRGRFLRDLAEDMALPTDLTELIDRLMTEPTYYQDDPDLLLASIDRISGNSENCGNPRLALTIEEREDEQQCSQLRDRLQDTLGEIARYLTETADTGRQDRLFPADLRVFDTNPLSVAHGAMGVLYALRYIGPEVPEELEAWALRREVSNDQYPPGLYMGQSGIAWALAELSHMDRAVGMMRSVREHDLLLESPDLLHGVAGYGLTCLKLWYEGAGDEFLDDAVKIGRHLAETSVRVPGGAQWWRSGGVVPLGYAHGGSGIALFLLYLSVATDDSAAFVLGREALAFELSHAGYVDGDFAGFPGRVVGGLETEGGPLACYWDMGSAGVGTTLLRYLAVRRDDDLEQWRDRLILDASRKYTVFPQLFHGLAGLGNFLVDAWQFTGERRHLMAAREAAEGILLFRVERQEGVTFPGEQARRECGDYATGSAGIGLFLDRLLKAENGRAPNFNFVVDELLEESES